MRSRNYRNLLLTNAILLLGLSAHAKLIYHTTMDSAAAIAAPVVGPAGTSAATASFIDGVKGKALYVPAGVGIAEVPFANGLPAEKGRVEYWAKIMTEKTSFTMEADPMFFYFTRPDLMDWRFFVEISANTGANQSGWRAFAGGYSFATYDYSSWGSYSTLLDNPKEWHHHEIIWNTNGLSSASGKFVSFRVDGVEKLSLPMSKLNPTSFKSWMDGCKVLYFSGSTDSNSTSKSPYAIDEFKVWDSDEVSEDLPVVSEVTAKQHYPWCGKIDISYAVTGKTEGLKAVISVRDNDNDLTYEAKTFDMAPSAAEGAHAVVWNAAADGVKKVSNDMVATVSLVVCE